MSTDVLSFALETRLQAIGRCAGVVVQCRAKPRHAVSERTLDVGDKTVLLGKREKQVYDVVLLEAAVERRVELTSAQQSRGE